MKKIFLIVLVILFAVGIASTVSAQETPYYFSVDKQVVNAYWNSDGTLSLDYVWDFINQPNGHAIEYVDVGMPNYNFSMDTIKADVNGAPVSVSQGDYAGSGSGFAIVMGQKSIPPGGKGTVHVYVGRVTGVLYPDDTDEAYASATFAPSWFGSEYVTGATDFSLTFHLPPNMNPDEPRWHDAPPGFPDEPQAGYDADNRVTYTWHSPTASASRKYVFGSSFPRTYIPADSIYVAPAEPLVSEDTVYMIFCGGFFAFMFIGMPAITAIANQRRKMQYMPPKVAIEGHGIKRGLTAVEAAILMEQPLDKVMTMILFGTLKKNAAEVLSRDPLDIQPASPIPDGLHEYELNFLRAFKEDDKKTRQGLLQQTMVKLVKQVSEKMKGFSRRETLEYYRSIMEKAWQQIEAADTPEVKSQKFDEALEWTMLDKNYDDRTRRVLHGPVFMPHWWGRYNPTYRPASSSKPTVGSGPLPTSGQPVSSSGRSALPGADIAAQMVTGVQTFSQKVVGNVNTFTERVTGATNPPPKPTSSGRSGGGGGRSCACACACAGCACACAGGGR